MDARCKQLLRTIIYRMEGTPARMLSLGPEFADPKARSALISGDTGIANHRFILCNYLLKTRGYPPRGGSKRRQGERSMRMNEGTRIRYFRIGPELLFTFRLFVRALCRLSLLAQLERKRAHPSFIVSQDRVKDRESFGSRGIWTEV